MKITPFYVGMLCIAAVMGSCKKKEDIESLVPEESLTAEIKEDLKASLKDAAQEAEVFKFDAQTGGTFTTSKGTILTIAPNIFTKVNGDNVKGTVELSFKEITEVSEMILDDKPTNAELPNRKDTLNPQRAVLQSLGEFKANAKQGGEELQLKSGAQIGVQVPNPPVADMQSVPLWSGDTTYREDFKGHDVENTAVTTQTPVPVQIGAIWTPLNQTAPINQTSVNGAQTPTMDFGISKLGEWRNCDVLLQFTRNTTILGYFSNIFSDTNVPETNLLYFKKKGDNVLIKLCESIYNAPEGKKGFLSYQNTFGIGMEGTFLALVQKDGKYYAQKKAATIGEPESGKNYVGIYFTLTEVSKNQMLDLIASMDNE